MRRLVATAPRMNGTKHFRIVLIMRPTTSTRMVEREKEGYLTHFRSGFLQYLLPANGSQCLVTGVSETVQGHVHRSFCRSEIVPRWVRGRCSYINVQAGFRPISPRPLDRIPILTAGRTINGQPRQEPQRKTAFFHIVILYFLSPSASSSRPPQG